MRRILSFVLVGFFLYTATAFAAIAYDNSSKGLSTSSASLTFTAHSVSAGANTLLAVYAECNACDASYASTVTHNGDALTEITGSRSTRASDVSGSWWYRIAPDSGAQSVVITYGASKTMIIGFAVSYTGAKQSAQPDASSNGAGQSTAPSVNLTTVADGSAIVSALATTQNWGSPRAIDSPFTSRQTDDSQSAANGQFGDSVKATAGVQACAWSSVDGAESYAMSNASFSPAGASTVKTITQVAQGVVKTVSGVTNATTKKIMGVTNV